MPNRDPHVLISSLSRTVTIDALTVEVQIYRLEHEPGWTLEVVNEEGTSTVWRTLFGTDEEAFAAFECTLDEQGMEPFRGRNNVIPFPQRH